MKKLIVTFAALLLCISGALADSYTFNNFGAPSYPYQPNGAWGMDANHTSVGFQFGASTTGLLTWVQAGMTNSSGNTNIPLFLYADNGQNAPGGFLGMAMGRTMPFSWTHIFPPVYFDFRGYSVNIFAGRKYWLIAFPPSDGQNFWNMNVTYYMAPTYWNGVVYSLMTTGAFAVQVAPIPG